MNIDTRQWLLAFAIGTCSAAAVAASPPATADQLSAAVAARFAITGNTLLPEAHIRSALAGFGRLATQDDARLAAQAVQGLYRDAGYGSVVVSITMDGAGTATVNVLEGRIGRVSLAGNQVFSDSNIRRSVPALMEGQTPQLRALNAQIELANQNPAKKVALTLERGSAPAEVNAQLTVNEREPGRFFFAADNTGNRQTGHLRATFGYQNAALWGLDHQASAQWQTSVEKPRQVSIVSFNYGIPLYPLTMRVDMYAARSNVDGGSTATAAGALQFTGRGNVFGAQLTKLLERQGELDQRLKLGLDQREYLNDCSIAGLPAGSCGPAGESVTVQPLTLEYAVQGDSDLRWAASAAVVHNLGLGGRNAAASNFSAVRDGARYRYSALRLNMQARPAVVGEWRLAMRLSAQVTADRLVSGEQFGLAGANAVRGYQERELIGDSGVLGSLELVSPDLTPDITDNTVVRLTAFADAGQARNRPGTQCLLGRERCTLYSAGLGVRVGAGAWRLSADAAVAGRDANRTERGSARLHFNASYALD